MERGEPPTDEWRCLYNRDVIGCVWLNREEWGGERREHCRDKQKPAHEKSCNPSKETWLYLVGDGCKWSVRFKKGASWSDWTVHSSLRMWWCERNRMNKKGHIQKHHQDKVGGSRLEKEDDTEWGKDPVRKSSCFWAFKWSYDVCSTSRKSQAFLWLLELWVVLFSFFISVVQIFYNVHAFCTKNPLF